jgi:hypothetical protein
MIVLLLAGITAGTAPAADAASPSPVQGIQVSPVLINLNAEKGQSYKLTLTVTNVTAGPLVLTSAINDFKAKNETGIPEVIVNNNQPSGTYSLHDWISPIPPFTLQSQQAQTIHFVVNVPPDGEAGGHYGVIRFSGVPPSQTGQHVALNASVGVLILGRVAGNITEQLALKQFFSEKNGHQASLMANGPVTLVARIQNIGNVHVEPIGNMTVKNTWGKTVATYPFGSQAENILPASIRRYSQNFGKPAPFGHYTVNLNAAYGTTGGVLIGSTSFWVISYKLLLLILAVLIILVLIGRNLVKRYNARVISRHTRR